MAKERKTSFSVEFLKGEIQNKYGTLREYADKIGDSEQNLNNKLLTQSPKFLRQLRDHGIIALPDENDSGLLKKIQELEDEARLYRETIRTLNTTVNTLNKRIADLEK